MTTHPADSGPSHLPPMRTIGELRAALTGVVRLVEEFRGRIIARQDPDFDTAADSAVAEISAARGTERSSRRSRGRPDPL